MAAISGIDPFIMQADGKAWLFAPAGVVDGPLPTHYEPQESPFRNPLYGQQRNPIREIIRHRENPLQPVGDQPGASAFPYVATTYRLTEHHTAGGMSRWLPYLSELQPEMFCEVSPELAAERGLENGGWATIITRAERDRGAGAGDRADAAADGAGPRGCTRSGCPTTGAPTASAPATPPTTWPTWSLRPERAHPGGQGARRATSARGAARAGPRCANWSREYAHRAGITDETGTEI